MPAATVLFIALAYLIPPLREWKSAHDGLFLVLICIFIQVDIALHVFKPSLPRTLDVIRWIESKIK